MRGNLSGGSFLFGDPHHRLTDPDRLRRLHETGLIDVRDDPVLDRLTRLAARITGEGVALMCLVEPTQLTLLSAHGLAGPLEANRQVPLSHSFCQYVVTNDAPLAVSDARKHPVLRHNPSVEGHGVVAYAGHPLRDPDGVVLGTLCLGDPNPREWSREQLAMLADITATVETELTLRMRTRSARDTETMLGEAARKQAEADERLAQLDRARNVFIATASHELRTPVSSILGYTELLLDGAAGALSPEQQELLGRVDGGGKRLFALVEEMLDLSPPDSSAATTEHAPLDANSPAESAWAAFQPHLAERGLHAHLELSPASPWISGDVRQIEQALLELLQNAAKFMPDGGTVRLSVRASPDGVEYEVTDTGVGMPEDEQAFAFEPFFRAQHAHSAAIPGAGIGLSTVRRIVEDHRGQVRLTSCSGSGTTVAVVLPAIKREELEPGPGHGALPATEPHEVAMVRSSPEEELRAALDGDGAEFVLHYQPIVDLTSGKVVAVESLVRWQHPERGLLAPEHIIALAEATGLIHQLGDWVLDRAVRDAASLTHEGRELDVAVNFSVHQVDGQAVAKVRRALESSGLRPDRLILEVAEPAFVEDEDTTAATYTALSGLGVKIAVDDFGTGFSSLLHLRRNPISALKIDSAFVAGIGKSPDDEAICESIIRLAGAVGASTVGEGVETAAQYAVLRSLGCLRGQGFLWSPAVPIDDLEAAFAACDEVPVAAPRARRSRAPEPLPVEVTAIIDEMHAKGASRHTISAALNRIFGRHPSGVRWTAGAVARELTAENGPCAVPALLPSKPGR